MRCPGGEGLIGGASKKGFLIPGYEACWEMGIKNPCFCTAVAIDIGKQE